MRSIVWSAVAGLLTLAASTCSFAAGAGTCGNYGTSVDFVSTPSDAARQAKQEQKLVFVLHVSGHFEDPKFT